MSFNLKYILPFQDGWSDLPLGGLETNVQNYPVQLVISVPSVRFEKYSK